MTEQKFQHTCAITNIPGYIVAVEHNIKTITSLVAYNACITCIEMNCFHLDELSDEPRPYNQLSMKKSAQQFVLECISHGGWGETISIDKKYAAILHFLNRGFPPCSQIFEFTYPFSRIQLIKLAKLEAIPISANLQKYVYDKKFKDILAIYQTIKDMKINCFIKSEYENELTKAGISY